mgnify:CR=1 FL=1
MKKFSFCLLLILFICLGLSFIVQAEEKNNNSKIENINLKIDSDYIKNTSFLKKDIEVFNK